VTVEFQEQLALDKEMLFSDHRLFGSFPNISLAPILLESFSVFTAGSIVGLGFVTRGHVRLIFGLPLLQPPGWFDCIWVIGS